jgi:hypothetical protein
MAQTKILGIITAPLWGGTDLQIEKCTMKLESEDVSYTAQGGGGWQTSFGGTAKKLTGSLETAFDTTFTASGGYMPPMSDDDVAVTLALGSHTLSFNAIMRDCEVEKDVKGLVKLKANFVSDGAVTYS